MNVAKIGCVAVALVLFTLAGCGKNRSLTPALPTAKQTVFTGDAEDSIRHSTHPIFVSTHKPRQCAQRSDRGGRRSRLPDISPYGKAKPHAQYPAIRLTAVFAGLQPLHSNNMCSPTRSTAHGAQPPPAGVGWVAEWGFWLPGYRGELAPDTVTLPSNSATTRLTPLTPLANGISPTANTARIGPFDSWPAQKALIATGDFWKAKPINLTPAENYQRQ